MRIIFTISILVLIYSFVNQPSSNIYYVDNIGGSDANSGTSSGAAWATIAKVNAQTFLPGDQILFKSGDVWHETLRPQSSGTSGSSIIYSSYGTGNKPELSGLTSVSMTDSSGNFWTGTISGGVAYQNTVIINGSIRAKGRYPNTGYIVPSPFTNAINGADTFYAKGLSSFPMGSNYVGAEIVTRGHNWVVDANKIAWQSGDTVVLQTPFTYAESQKKYFIQNCVQVLDLQNEWCYDSLRKVVTVYSTTAPTVQASTIDTLITFHKQNYLTFDGLCINGANNVGINKDSCNGIVIQNCTIKNIGGYNPLNFTTYGGQGGAAIKAVYSDGTVIQNDSLINCLNNGIFEIHTPSTVRVKVNNNYLKNIGIWPGMGCPGNGSYTGINNEEIGDSGQYINNRIDSVGYCGLVWNQTNSLIYHNYITNFCFVKSDGAAISSAISSGPTAGTLVRANILINGVDPDNSFIGAGFYFDGAAHITSDSNTISNCSYIATFITSTSYQFFYDNTIVDSVGRALQITGGSPANNSYFTRNVIYQKGKAFRGLYTTLPASTNIANTIDSNYYLHDPTDTGYIYDLNANSFYNLSKWQRVSGYDLHTKDMPTGITTGVGVLYYNPTLTDSTITLDRNKIDAKGLPHSHTVILHPFQSIILFNALGTGHSRIAGLNFN